MPRSIKLLAVAVVVLFALYSVQNTFAVLHAGVLDQTQTVIDAALGLAAPPASGSVTDFLGQTFTAGLTGSLTEVDLAIACFSPAGLPCTILPNGAVTVEIHSGSPSGALLGSSSLAVSAFPMIGVPNPTGFVAFIFSSPSVVAGSVYAMVITTTNAPAVPPQYTVGAASTGPYSAGDLWVWNGAVWATISDGDLAFETFVTPLAIPEYPLGLPLLAIFMVISYGLIRRRTSTKKL